ncbi:MAG: arylsulfatase [Planctomycetales bacterium]|nr:arylsulfatase [Planctomycetales bacterium]
MLSLPIALAVALGLLFLSSAAASPNLIVIVADDQGWGDLSLHGNKNLSTPHIDSLAQDGASFDRFYVCPVCAPTRAEFFTGRYHPRSRVYGVSTGLERMDLDEVTIADMFRAAGYATAAFGKWHNGTQFPYHPNARGFSEFYGFCSGHWGNYFDPMLDHNGQIVQGEGFLIDDLTDHAIRFMKDHSELPFFVYLPYNTPHSPMQVPDRWWETFRDKPLAMSHRYQDREDADHTRAALAMCENIDWNVGRILQTLDELELAEETIVVYFSDNGPNRFRWNGDMRGKKGSTDEGGVRSPLFIRWPGKINAKREIPQIAAAIDLLPTLAELTGVELTNRKPLDGISFKEQLLGLANELPSADRRIFSHWAAAVSVRTQQYRLDHEGHLYDMIADPGQRQDVSKQHPQIAAELSQAVKQWKDELLSNRNQERRPFLVGHPASRSTQLPARDAESHGKIKRSSRHPNCSFFTNWQRTSDRIDWNVEVLQSGVYEAELYYTCASSDVGSTVELSFGEGKVAGTVDTAHDPPLQGEGQDRVPRDESYVKDFGVMKLGRIELAKGQGPLTLQAQEVANQNVMDFRLLVLTKCD